MRHFDKNSEHMVRPFVLEIGAVAEYYIIHRSSRGTRWYVPR